MTDVFNPTAKDLLLLDEKIIELKAQKRKLITDKVNAERTLTVLQGKYAGLVYNGPEFMKVKEDRNAVKADYLKVELAIRKINEEIAYKTSLKNEVQFHISGKKSIPINDKAVRQLIALKEKYNSFAKDRTRVSSMRIMASEIRDELEKIIDTL